MSNTKELTPKEKRFCEEYLIDLNGTQAAIRAGYSKNSACEIASQNLAKLHIQTYIEGRQKELFLKLGISQERILQEYARIAFSDPRHMFDDNSRMLPIKGMPDHVAPVISSIENEELFGFNKEGDRERIGDLKKIKLWDKKGALDSLAKYFGMITDKVDVTSKGKELQGQQVIKATLNLG